MRSHHRTKRPFLHSRSTVAIPLALVETAKETVPAELTEEEVRATLTLNSPELTDEMFGIVRSLLEREQAVEARIDAKAAGLVGVAGLSSTVAFAVLGHTDAFTHFEHRRWVLGLFCFGELAALLAAGAASWSLRVQQHRSPGGRAIFDKALVEMANDHPALPRGRKTTDAWNRTFGLMEYRKALTLLRDACLTAAGRRWRPSISARAVLGVDTCSRDGTWDIAVARTRGPGRWRVERWRRSLRSGAQAARWSGRAWRERCGEGGKRRTRSAMTNA